MHLPRRKLIFHADTTWSIYPQHIYKYIISAIEEENIAENIFMFSCSVDRLKEIEVMRWWMTYELVDATLTGSEDALLPEGHNQPPTVQPPYCAYSQTQIAILY